MRDPPLQILYQDAHLIAVNKPPGLAVIPGRGETDSVLEYLARQLNLPCSGTPDPRLRVVHRLDKQTSGVLLFATDITGQRCLSHQFQNNQAAKEYLAIVAGQPGEESGQIDAPLGPSRSSPQRMAITSRGRPARTLWRIEQRFGPFSLLRVFPHTGKTHQIRVHLLFLALPLAVDEIYNSQSKGIYLSSFKRAYRKTGDERPLISRLTLHAEKLSFLNVESQSVQITAPFPKDFRATLNMLGKYGRR